MSIFKPLPTQIFLFLLISANVFSQDRAAKLKTFVSEAENNFKNEKFDEALVNLDSALAIDPDYARIYQIRGAIYQKKEQLRRAINEYSNAIRFNQNDPEAYYQRAVLRNEVGDHRSYSLNDINKAIELDPENPMYYVEKSRFLTSSTYPYPEYQLAIQSVTNAIRLDPDNGEYYNLRAKYKTEADQRLAALPDYSKAIELDPSNAEYYYDRGLSYLIIEDYLSAIEDMNSALKIDPMNPTYLMNRGQARFNLNDYETAILDFTLSIETCYKKISEIPGKITLDHPLNQTLRRAYLYRGSALLQSESTFEACQDFEAAENLGEAIATQYIGRYCH